MKIPENSKILIIGLHLTSRTEALRDYLLSRVRSISVIALSSFAVSKKENHAFYYENGTLKQHYIFAHKILETIKRRQLIIPSTFFIYCIDILRSLIIFRKKFDLFIGISHFSGLIGAIFKSIGICKRSIYYTIDYYAPHKQEHFDSPYKGINWFDQILLKLSNYADKLAILHSDEVWDISPRIEEGRVRFSSIKRPTYRDKKKIVPLGYSPRFFRNKKICDIDRYAIVFAGVVVESQGLELILETLPRLVDIMPQIKVRIIGSGPFLPRFKTMVSSKQLQPYFKFYGFIEDVEQMLGIIASSAVGVSLWDDINTKILNAYYGDPGKTKLYSVCGLPVVVSHITVYAQIIIQHQAGVAIRYNSNEFFKSLKTILLSDKDYTAYKERAVFVGRKYCNAEEMFNGALN